MTTDSRQRRKAALDRKIKVCRKCDGLNEPEVTEAAPGFGSLYSPVAIVGEALCRACMEKQEPFYGGSGRFLDRCFARAGVAKSDLFITNSIHCGTWAKCGQTRIRGGNSNPAKPLSSA